MDLISFLNNRQINCVRHKPQWDFLIKKYTLSSQYLIEGSATREEPTSPLALQLRRNLLVTVTEGGQICLLQRERMNCVSQWQGHNNAIFDVKWRQNFDQIMTASGDQTAILWDACTSKSVRKLDAMHKSSIRSISFSNENVFASGARDGVIKLWDLRLESDAEIAAIPDAHKSNSHNKTGRTPTTKAEQLRSVPTSSVTCVLFSMSSNHLYSGGANDGAIKLWDIRKLFNGKGKPHPVLQIPYLVGKAHYSESQGFNCLAFDQTGRLYACCSDNSTYCYNPANPMSAIRFDGPKVNNYTKIKLINDDYLISGSTDGNVYVWPLKTNSKESVRYPSYYLPQGHDEVTAVECEASSLELFTCSDDQRISKWILETFNPQRNDFDHLFSMRAQVYEKKLDEIMNTVPMKRKNTPEKRTSLPFGSLTNWLQPRSETTPPNLKIQRTSASTPLKRISKENKVNSRHLKKSKLFGNRKISDYLKSK